MIYLDFKESTKWVPSDEGSSMSEKFLFSVGLATWFTGISGNLIISFSTGDAVVAFLFVSSCGSFSCRDGVSENKLKEEVDNHGC